MEVNLKLRFQSLSEMNLRNWLDVEAELDFITKLRVTDSACCKTVDKPKF